ncbi:MAG TPA: hypothetical protein V6D06_01440 [Trichocoleus sp.]
MPVNLSDRAALQNRVVAILKRRGGPVDAESICRNLGYDPRRMYGGGEDGERYTRTAAAKKVEDALKALPGIYCWGTPGKITVGLQPPPGMRIEPAPPEEQRDEPISQRPRQRNVTQKEAAVREVLKDLSPEKFPTLTLAAIAAAAGVCRTYWSKNTKLRGEARQAILVELQRRRTAGQSQRPCLQIVSSSAGPDLLRA